jgi:hypothetical protein
MLIFPFHRRRFPLLWLKVLKSATEKQRCFDIVAT